MARNEIEVNFVDCCFQTRAVDAVNPQPFESYPLGNIQKILPVYSLGVGTPLVNPSTRYHFTDMLQVHVSFLDGSPTWKYDIQDVSNQAGWTADLAGLIQAVADICAAHAACTAGGAAAGLATEATLLLIQGYLAPQTLTLVNVIAVGVGSIPAGARRGSAYNEGPGTTVWNGVAHPPGFRQPIGVVGDNETYGAIPYDATGATVHIEYTT